MNFINEINDILWTYILIIMLLGCAVWFSIRTRFVQFRMLREMIILLSESAGKGKQGEKHVLNPEKPDVPLNKNDAFQKVQKRHVQEKR